MKKIIKTDKITPRERRLREKYKDLNFDDLLEVLTLKENSIDFSEVKKWSEKLNKSLAPKIRRKKKKK